MDRAAQGGGNGEQAKVACSSFYCRGVSCEVAVVPEVVGENIGMAHEGAASLAHGVGVN